MIRRLGLSLAISLVVCCSVLRAEDPNYVIDPFWVLVHEPAVLKDLDLNSQQRVKYVTVLDNLDPQFFPLRNHPQATGQPAQEQIVADVRLQLKSLLTAEQSQRLKQLELWKLGIGSLLHDDVARTLAYSDSQRGRLEKVYAEMQKSLAAVEKQVSEGKPRSPLDKQYANIQAKGQKQLLEILSSQQQAEFKRILGEPFDLTQLGRAAYKAPELVDTQQWINSRPLKLADQRGKVVVIHFYACGCINCIHNYPWYRDWQKRYAKQNFVMIGIQTPETSAERQFAHVETKAREAELTFPILFDEKSENWKAWGNSMWPTVYVIDQRGYLRYFWTGELKWQNNDGELFIRERIDGLLKEKVDE